MSDIVSISKMFKILSPMLAGKEPPAKFEGLYYLT